MKSRQNDLEKVSFHVNFTYELEEVKALNNVSDSFKKGKFIVLVGPSACGKTTLLRCINHLIPEFYEGNFQGFIKIFGKDISKESIGEVGKEVSSIFQDPRSQFFTLESDTEVAFGLENFGYSKCEIQKRVELAFKKFGIEALMGKEVFRLSSGERQIISIASAWAMNTDVILLDEPTANLDLATIKKVESILKELKLEGKTIVASEHRLHYLKDLADEFWFMEKGEIKEKFTSNEFKAMNCEKLGEIGLRLNDLDKLKLSNMDRKKINSQSCLEIKDLSFSYKANKKIFENINFKANKGECIFIIGQNGCGKTSLGKCISGILKANSGKIVLKGKSLTRKALVDKSIFIMQEAEFQFFTNSVLTELQYGQDGSKYPQIEKLLKEFGMWEFRNRHPFSLSGGQMQKLTLMMACISEKEIILLDEPTAGLDKKSLDICINLIKKMSLDKVVIVISHDLELIAEVADFCIEIKDSTINEIIEMDSLKKIFKVREILENDDEKKYKVQENNSVFRNSFIDPRVNLVYLFFAAIMIAMANKNMIGFFSIAILILAIVDGHYKVFLLSTTILGLIYGMSIFIPNELTLFIVNMFPRFILIAIILPIVLGNRGASNMLAGLRSIKVPERIIMICAVCFRFFPVLKKDLELMKQSIKSRVVGRKSLIQKTLLYIEAIIISMVFRAIRISESLSASAETRGIALENKRSSLIDLKFKFKDYFMLIVLIIFIIVGIIKM